MFNIFLSTIFHCRVPACHCGISVHEYQKHNFISRASVATHHSVREFLACPTCTSFIAKDHPDVIRYSLYQYFLLASNFCTLDITWCTDTLSAVVQYFIAADVWVMYVCVLLMPALFLTFCYCSCLLISYSRWEKNHITICKNFETEKRINVNCEYSRFVTAWLLHFMPDTHE